MVIISFAFEIGGDRIAQDSHFAIYVVWVELMCYIEGKRYLEKMEVRGNSQLINPLFKKYIFYTAQHDSCNYYDLFASNGYGFSVSTMLLKISVGN
jgi:hypothetical protein